MADDQQTDVTMQLAFRSEGQFINAYLEHHGKDPFMYLIGSLRASMVDPLVRAAWEASIELAIGRFSERLSGQPAVFNNRRRVPVGGTA